MRRLPLLLLMLFGLPHTPASKAKEKPKTTLSEITMNHTAAKDTSPVTKVGDVPTTGTAFQPFHDFDAMILAHMKEHNLPGGAVAVVREGRLVYARGYGYADKGSQAPVEPTSLFRFASVSKPITGVAIMTLVQNPRIRLDLDAKAFPLLGLKPFLKRGQKEDPRIWDITIRQLLLHSAGWDRDKSGDIMFKHFEIAKDMGIESPPDHTSLLRWAMGQPLDFAPGERYAYSNFGYCVLGRLIEKVSGMSYEKYVQKAVLAPAGITTMHIGNGRRSEPLEKEVCYYHSGNGTGRSVFSEDGRKRIPTAYAFASPRTMDAHGGWVGSAIDLMRLAVALDGTGKKQILTAEASAQMMARPQPPLGVEKDGSPSPIYYALGWSVRPVGRRGKGNFWHAGGMPGTATIFVRLSDGMSWALLFNQDKAGDIDGLMHRAAATVKAWPEHDLFRRYR
jgi:CubicO group peptidase (beta-lactamase class C family)